MIPSPKETPMLAALRVMSADEIANEGLAGNMLECVSLPASIRSHVGSILHILREHHERDDAMQSICESVVCQMAASMMHSCLPFVTADAIFKLEAADKKQMSANVFEVAEAFSKFAPKLEARLHEIAADVSGRQQAIVDAVEGTKNVQDEEARIGIVQRAFEKGEYNAGPATGGDGVA